MKKFIAVFILFILPSIALANMRQVTCAASSTLIATGSRILPSGSLTFRKNLYVKNIHGSAVNVTVCLSDTCTTGTGVTLTQFQDYENRYYQGPVSCIGTNTITLIVED